MKLTREAKTGLLAVAAIILFIFGYSFLKGQNLLSSDRTFYAVYDDVGGLSSSSAIHINGLQVGKVSNISFINGKGQLLVTMNLSNDFTFSKNSIAKITSDGIIGGKSMTIELASGGPTAQSGDTLAGRIEKGLIESVGSKLEPLQKKVESAIVNADSLISGINHVLGPNTRKDLKTAIADLSKTMAAFKGTSSSLEKLLTENDEKLNRTFTNLDEMSTNFNQLSDTLAHLDIKKLVGNLQNVVSDFEKISSNLEQGNGTLGKLLNDEAVYTNLENATKQLQELLQDIKLNPDRYVHISVFGGKADKYEPPKDPTK
ncbi:MAG TPA: MlaD family protein [Flavobacteriaceae bacterium]|nr:MlaD family protein [Flavobacteriaceae bacterium]